MWREKVLIASLLCGIGLALYWAVRLEPSGPNHAVRGPVFLPPCAFKIRYDMPCPTCYMTRTCALMVRGRVTTAFAMQPFAAATFAAMLFAAPLLVVALVSRRPLWPVVARWRWRMIVAIAILSFAGSWGYTILRDAVR